MNPCTKTRALKVLNFVADRIRDTLALVGLMTVHELASKRWPEETKVAGFALLVLIAGGFVWCVLVSPFLEGLREGKNPDPA